MRASGLTALGGADARRLGHWALTQAVVSFEINVALYNELPSGTKDYLSADEAMLPTVFLAMFVMYLTCLVLWIWTMYSKQTTTLKIHYLMAGLLMAKVRPRRAPPPPPPLLSSARTRAPSLGRYELIKTHAAVWDTCSLTTMGG